MLPAGVSVLSVQDPGQLAQLVGNTAPENADRECRRRRDVSDSEVRSWSRR